MPHLAVEVPSFLQCCIPAPPRSLCLCLCFRQPLCLLLQPRPFSCGFCLSRLCCCLQNSNRYNITEPICRAKLERLPACSQLYNRRKAGAALVRSANDRGTACLWMQPRAEESDGATWLSQESDGATWLSQEGALTGGGLPGRLQRKRGLRSARRRAAPGRPRPP